MSFALWSAVYFIGMGSQAMISAVMFPSGIDPGQQLRAAFLFFILALVFAIVAAVCEITGRPRR